MGALGVGVGDRRRLWWGEGARAEQSREDRERAGAAGQRECGGGPGAVDKRAGPGCPEGAADLNGGGEPGERLGHGPRGRRSVDHGVQGGLGRRDRGAGEHQHGPEREHAPGRRDQR